MIGRTISHYRILENLGEGGMGVVYKAEDTKLRRIVALKFLPPELTRDADAKARFIQEAQAASALDHPNICGIHEIDETAEGQLFICMAFCEGETLGEKIKWGPLSIEEAVRIAAQVAHGLAAAHARGIVHRDIKPANVIVTAGGLAKILDFGLAKLAGQVRLTRASSTSGTAAYMSPEQTRGDEVDARTDIWSVGVMLFEMLTGRLPFKGDYEQAVAYSIVNEAPASLAALRPDVPEKLAHVVGTALAKGREARYGDIREMIADLDALMGNLRMTAPAAVPRVHGAKRARLWIGLAAAVVIAVLALVFARPYYAKPREKPITSIAVIPFENMSADPGQEYFSDGMTEAIIKELSQIKALRVISRTSAMRYKKTEKSLPEIARELGVDAVVEGSVLRADKEVRITAQLIAAHPEKHLWAEDFTRTLENVLVLQSEVAQAIAREIRVTVTPDERNRIARAHTVNPRAHEMYLRAKYLGHRSDPDDWRRSIRLFQQAIDEDSTFALAYAGIAEIYDRLASAGFERPSDAWPKVRTYVEKALALDPDLVEGLLSLAELKIYYDYDAKSGEMAFDRALELDPHNAMGLFWHGWFLGAFRGRFEDGIAEMKRAVSIDPLWPRIYFGLAWMYVVKGEYDSAHVYIDRIAEIDSNDAHIFVLKPNIYLRQGKYAEAIETAQRGIALGITPCIESLAIAYALSGQPGRARETLAELLEEIGGGYYPPIGIADVYAALGERDKALEYLEQHYRDRNFPLSPYFMLPWWKFMESDPRYQEIMKKGAMQL